MSALGEVIGVTDEAIRLMEKGKRYPSYEVLLYLAGYFGVPVDYLAGNNGADLTRAILAEADMRRVKACGAIFHEADLSGANLQDADLRWADFSGANLQGANLAGARLDGTNFLGANVTGTILEGKIVDGRFVP